MNKIISVLVFSSIWADFCHGSFCRNLKDILSNWFCCCSDCCCGCFGSFDKDDFDKDESWKNIVDVKTSIESWEREEIKLERIEKRLKRTVENAGNNRSECGRAICNLWEAKGLLISNRNSFHAMEAYIRMEGHRNQTRETLQSRYQYQIPVDELNNLILAFDDEIKKLVKIVEEIKNEKEVNEDFVKFIVGHMVGIISEVKKVWFVLTRTDDDHVNIFDDIAKICKAREKVIQKDLIQKALNSNILFKNTLDRKKLIQDTLIKDILAEGALRVGTSDQKKLIQDTLIEGALIQGAIVGTTKDGIKTSIVNLVLENIPKIKDKVFPMFSIVNGIDYYAYRKGLFQLTSWWKKDLDSKKKSPSPIFESIVKDMNDAFLSSCVKIEFLCPQFGYDVGFNVNAASIVTKLISYASDNAKKISVLFTGDAPGKLFTSICDNPSNIGKLENIDLLICPHHGSMSNDSYRWRGELNHLKMISIISSTPIASSKIPERSFLDYAPMRGLHFSSHFVAYHSKLDNRCQYRYRKTCAPVFVTACSGTGIGAGNSNIKNIVKGIGYFVSIGSLGEIEIFDIVSNFLDYDYVSISRIGIQDIIGAEKEEKKPI